MRSVSELRVLLAILVYNGRGFVPACLESAARVKKGGCDVDVLVLDDCSPEPGWSTELEEICGSSGIDYYRSPRNIGIPRNMNLGLLRGVHGGYDYTVILNSDVILPMNLADVMVSVAESNERVGSVTLWSNNCSIYSLPNVSPDEHLADQAMVDWVSEMLGGEFGPQGVEIPAAVGFCMMISSETVRKVGLFDPLFGRGYCEELDWCLRAQSMGYRNLLATNGFAYHMGSGSTRDAGLLSGGATTVDAHERIIDWRYPLFRHQVAAFLSSDISDRMKETGLRRLLFGAAAEWGYEVRCGALPANAGDDRPIFRIVEVPGGAALNGYFKGFVSKIAIPAGQSGLEILQTHTGKEPHRVVFRGGNPLGQSLQQEAVRLGLTVDKALAYPEHI